MERLVDRALDQNRNKRYQSMDDVQEDAEPILTDLNDQITELDSTRQAARLRARVRSLRKALQAE